VTIYARDRLALGNSRSLTAQIAADRIASSMVASAPYFPAISETRIAVHRR